MSTSCMFKLSLNLCVMRSGNEGRCSLEGVFLKPIDMCQCVPRATSPCHRMAFVHQLPRKWLSISSAPSDGDVELSVIDRKEVHALVFPCRKKDGGWIDVSTKKPIDVQPTHWRLWTEDG